MFYKYIWITFFFITTLIVLYLQFYDKLVITTIKRNLLKSPGSSSKSVNTFKILLFPLKNKLLEFTPQNIKNNLEELINVSGVKWHMGDILLVKIFLPLSFALISMTLFPNIFKSTLFSLLLIALMFLTFFLPDFILKQKAQARRSNIKNTLAPFIDYLTISVEAGMGLDMAMARVISQLHGPLAEEIAHTMTEIKYGKSKKSAFKNLSSKINVPELTSFLNALISGEQLGISLGSILRVQGEQIREKRKQQIQEEAYKIPVKLVFPLVLFILPGLFVVLLGPAIISASNSLFN